MSAVWKRTSAVSIDAVSSLFAFTLLRRSVTTGWFGFISSVFRPAIMPIWSLLWNACAFITFSCWAEYPNCEVTTTTGDSVSRFETSTFSILTPASFIAPFSVSSVSLSFHQSVSGLYMSLSFENRFFLVLGLIKLHVGLLDG